VKLRGINKGVAVTKVLTKVTALFGEVDFILCIGDDRSDEDMFEAVNAFLEPAQEDLEESMSQFSTTDESDARASSEQQGDADALRRPSKRSDSARMDLLPRHNSDDGAGLVGRSSSMGGLGGGGMGLGRSSSKASRHQTLGGGLAGLASMSEASSQGFGRMPSHDSSGFGEKTTRFFTCTVGRKSTAAKFYLDDTEEVSELLGNMKSQHERKQFTQVPPSHHTWSGGFGLSSKNRLGSMPALSSLSFGRSGSGEVDGGFRSRTLSQNSDS
jgi:trehalose 6-phosphate synthase/phosphatase